MTELDILPDPRKMAPVKAAPSSEAMENWIVAYRTGYSSEGKEDWAIVTDHVNASAFIFLEFPGDAKTDAESIAAILNAYREGRLVPS